MRRKFGLRKADECILAKNNSQISKSDLNSIMKTISLNFLYIVYKWKEVHGTENVKFYR